MYKLGVVVSLILITLVGACACTGTHAAGNMTRLTPTLPAQYVAGESTPAPGVTTPPTPTPPTGNPANIYGAQTNVTLTQVTIACTGNTCTSGTTNSSSSGSTTVTTLPVTSISGNVTMAYVKQNPNVAVQFSDSQSNIPPYSWMWSWTPAGNLTYESDPSIILLFNQYGNYQITRTVSNSVGSASSSASISVCPLIASFVTNSTYGPVPLTVKFMDTSSDQPISWAWNFGDGFTSNLQNPVHTYTTSGSYTVRLDATNSLGTCGNTTGVTVSPMTAAFSMNQSAGLAPMTVQFSDTSTDQPTSWSWKFGDGSISALQNPVHTYTAAGTYLVSFSATNGYDGWINAPQASITVYSLPNVVYSASPLTGHTGTSVVFNDKSTGFPAPSTFYWDFGDGFTSTQQNPSHQYVQAGTYTVSHSATSAEGTVWLNETGYITIS